MLIDPQSIRAALEIAWPDKEPPSFADFHLCEEPGISQRREDATLVDEKQEIRLNYQSVVMSDRERALRLNVYVLDSVQHVDPRS